MTRPLRIAFMGCVDFSRRALAALLALESAEIAGVITRSASPANADFAPLAPLAEAAGAPVHFADRADEHAERAFLEQLNADALYCFGWSRLLAKSVIEAPRLGAIGFHPSPLPRGRGRHPIIWPLVLGMDATASSFFYMTEGADEGDLISQRPVPILPEDDAQALYDRVAGVAVSQIADFTPQLRDGAAPRIPQNASLASIWRKRSAADGRIDWRMDADAIVNLVRALRPPYPGATCMYLGADRLVMRAEYGPRAPRDAPPGLVLASSESGIVVKAAGTSAVRLLEHALMPLPEQGNFL